MSQRKLLEKIQYRVIFHLQLAGLPKYYHHTQTLSFSCNLAFFSIKKTLSLIQLKTSWHYYTSRLHLQLHLSFIYFVYVYPFLSYSLYYRNKNQTCFKNKKKKETKNYECETLVAVCLHLYGIYSRIQYSGVPSPTQAFQIILQNCPSRFMTETTKETKKVGRIVFNWIIEFSWTLS